MTQARDLADLGATATVMATDAELSSALSTARIPSGNTAGRPASPVIGDTYYDGTLGFLLIWEGTQWIPCSAPAAQPTIAVTDVGTGVAYGTVRGSVAFTEGATGGKAAGFTAIQGSNTSTSTSSPIVLTITGNPGSYAFSGTAYNGFGTSPSSLTVSQTLTSVPQAPSIGTATAAANANEVTVTWTNGATGGKNISAITVTPYLNGTTAGTARTAATTSSTSYTFSEGQLTGGSAYTFKVKATNANGDSLESSASNSATMPNVVVVDYLVVAGGGAGNYSPGNGGTGGGGAGGLRSTVTATGGGGTLETPLGLSPSTNYTVTVGAGGASVQSATYYPGANSVFSSITSVGGGSGGVGQGTAGQAGGSGGGNGENTNTGSGGAGTANQGYAGGNANTGSDGAGGGGAGAVGGAGVNGTAGGNGGNGVAVAITGSSVTYAGGGGGSTYTGSSGGNGGTGGGGNGTVFGVRTSATPGTANTGGGGGSIGGSRSYGGNSAGGSGIVILRYPDTRTITIGAGLTGSTATVGSNKVTTITAGSGNVSWA